MRVWQIIFPVCILRRTTQNLPIPVSYFHPPVKKDGPEALSEIAVFLVI